MDKSDVSYLDLSISSVEWSQRSMLSSTPRKRNHSFRVPAAKRAPGKIVGTCTFCGKGYRSQKYLEKHELDHKMKDAAQKFPSEQRLREARDEIAVAVSKKMEETPVVVKNAQLCHELVINMMTNLPVNDMFQKFVEVCHQKFVTTLPKKKFCLPSALLKDIQTVEEEISNDMNFRKTLQECFENVGKEVFNTFFVDYVSTLGDVILHFIKNYVVQEVDQTLTLDVAIPAEERQLIHYVSGAIIKAFIKKCRQYKTSGFWTHVHNAIMKCIIEGDVVVSVADQDKYWTDFCNRGALCFVGKSFLEFMTSVAKFFHSLVKEDGSLYHDEVQEKLMLSEARMLWDEMIGCHLSEDESLKFMRAVVRSFTSTYGRGISLKHINKVLRKPTVSMSLRRKLGAKSAN